MQVKFWPLTGQAHGEALSTLRAGHHLSHFVPTSELTFLPPLPQKSAAKSLAVTVDGELVNTGPGRAPAFTDLTDSRTALFLQY